MARIIQVISVVVTLGCAACASGQREITAGPNGAAARVTGVDGASEIEQGRSTEVVETAVDASPGKTWDALPDVYLAIGLPVGTMDTRLMSIGNANFRARPSLAGRPLSTYFRCGMNAFGMDNADSYTVMISIITQVVAAETNRSRLRSVARASASRESMSEHPVACTSTGALERVIAVRMQERVSR